MVAAQAVELAGQAGEPGAIGFQAAFDKMDIIGGHLAAVAVRQVAVDDVLGHRRAHQAGEVGLDAVAQPPQGIGPSVQRRQAEIGQRALHLALGDLVAQRAGQRLLELLAGGRHQRQALGTNHGINGAGFGGGPLALGGMGGQRDHDQGQGVAGQRDQRHHVPVRLAGQQLHAGESISRPAGP